MKQLKQRMKQQFPGIPVGYPANHCTASYPVKWVVAFLSFVSRLDEFCHAAVICLFSIVLRFI